MSRFVSLAAAATVFLGSFAQASEIRNFGVLPINSSPGYTFFQGQDGFFYGVLLETNLPMSLQQQVLQDRGVGRPKTNGAVYQLSPSGALRYLHKFPYVHDYSVENQGGAGPTDLLAMGRDGFLYGLARAGGLFGHGVFYKLSVDGAFEVVSQMPGPDYFPYYFMGFHQGPDDAFYVCRNSDPYGQILRLGLDGTISAVGAPTSKINTFFLHPSPASNLYALVWFDSPRIAPPEGWQNTITVRWVELPSGAVVSEQSFQPFPNTVGPSDIHLERAGEEGIYMYADSLDWSQSAPGQLVLLKNDGSTSVISNFTWNEQPGASALPPAPHQLVPVKEGGYYFSSGPQLNGVIGVGGGSRLYRMLPDGTFSMTADFKGNPVISMFQGADQFLYAVSWGSQVEQDPEPADGAVRTAVRTAVSSDATVAVERTARLAVGGVSRARHGAFRIAPNIEKPNLAPFAGIDRVVLPRAKAVRSTVIPVLNNDRDPERQPLTISHVDDAQFGAAAITLDTKGRQRITYTPNALPSSSEIVHYTVSDPDGMSASGQILIRGDVAGAYRQRGAASEGQNTPQADAFTAGVQPTGAFSVSVTAAGVRLAGTGVLDYTDSATVRRKTKDGKLLVLKLHVQTVAGGKALAYEYRIDDALYAGSVAR